MKIYKCLIIMLDKDSHIELNEEDDVCEKSLVLPLNTLLKSICDGGYKKGN